jgi:hypothetical protein
MKVIRVRYSGFYECGVDLSAIDDIDVLSAFKVFSEVGQDRSRWKAEKCSG